MELSLSRSSSSITIISKFPPKPTNFHTQTFSPLFPPTLKFPNSTVDSGHRSSRSPFRNTYSLSISSSSSSTRPSAATSTAPPAFASPSSTTNGVPRHWMVVVEKPPEELNSKPEIIDYYVNNLKRVLNSEKDAQKCIYNASCQTDYWFCCEIDEENALNLAGLPGVLSVEPDADFNAIKPLEFIGGNYQHWVVRTEKPNDEFITKSQAVDYYTQILTNIMQNEKEAQKCIYHVWWQSNFGFCCELDENGAKKLAGVPGVLSVRPDENFESDIKGENLQQSGKPEDSSPANQPANIKTKKLFITGLSFYTSEKTLRAAFEGFGEIVEVKVIMDKISKRSKGYAFIEYTTEEAASAALKEMNGKIINGWMIVVDVAKPSANRSRRPRSTI